MNLLGKKVLLTGANGFIGSAIANALLCSRFDVLQAVRKSTNLKETSIGSLDDGTDWNKVLTDCSVVVHCAARVHVMKDAISDSLSEYRKVNVAGTLNLAKQAACAGVKRFIFLSSIKVNGEETNLGRAYTDQDVAAPQDEYAISKAEAEVGLRSLADETGMEVVIIRPPLVYGPGVKGNFYTLMSLVARGLPLPFGLATTNRRSFVSVDNLVSLIMTCIDHPNAANQTFLVSDGEDLSTTDLLLRIGKSLNCPVRLVPIPVNILIILSWLLGKKPIAQRLLGSLQLDISKTCSLLNWKPPVPVDEGLRRVTRQRM